MAGLVLEQISKLEKQLNILREQARLADQQGRRAYKVLARKDERFHCLSDLFCDYADELFDDLARLQRLSQKTADLDLLQLYCDRLCGKFIMLQEVLNRRPNQQTKDKAKVDAWRSKVKKVVDSGNLTQLYAKLEQQHIFEHRLKEEIDKKILQLNRSGSIEQSAVLQKSILDLKTRYGRCQRTTWQLEQLIKQKQSR
ncbi:primosomal replication protein PriC [Celerinatantimonas sp. MCCC 1A17872]|uniref:primosomal replication protein PriC n=1 Tax=Celerinatantimonas sp. MCCC 1A17872 TaxID=3177514 RepID=UPI0038C74986